MKRAVVIGAGFAGLSTAAYLARAGWSVEVFERGNQPGGRAHVVKHDGFTFELGPSWYLMPDVFEDWFADFGHKVSDFYDLVPLSPSYRVFGHGEPFDIGRPPEVFQTFEEREAGAGAKLKELLRKTAQEYSQVRGGLLDLDGLSLTQALRPDVLGFVLRPELARSYHGRMKRYFKDPALQQTMEFMTVFMGGSPKNVPAYYSLLAHVDMGLGGWYPMGGFGAVARALEAVAQEQGARFHYGAEVASIVVEDGQAHGVVVNGQLHEAEVVVSAADYQFTETKLLPKAAQTYPSSYWQRKQLAPSGLLVTLGVKRPVQGLEHHNLFFDTDWEGHFDEVFTRRTWSSNPLFYLCVPSKTDAGVAPEGQDNLFFLAPMAPGLTPTQTQMDDVADRLIKRVEQATNDAFSTDIVTRRVYAHQYFEQEFHASGGNAFGLSHTLLQSAVLRPRIRSKKVSNMYYSGQFTNPGTGVPMVMLSGKLVAGAVDRYE